MKNISVFILFLLNFYVALSQSPALINYQAVVRDANGNLITSGTISLGISIHDAIVGGNQLYFETHNGITPNAFGVVNVLIGGGTVVAGNFLMINWGNGNKYLQVYVNSNPIGSRTQMVSVPYALYANKAGKADSATFATSAATAVTANSLVNPPVVNTGWADYLIAYEYQPNNTAAGNAIGGGFTQRNLNRVQTLSGNAISFDSVAHTITFNQAGIYYIRASAPAWQVSRHQLVVRNTVSNAILLTGTAQHTNNSTGTLSTSLLEGCIIISNVTTIKLDHFFEQTSTAGTQGLGTYSALASGLNGVYAQCFVQKIQ